MKMAARKEEFLVYMKIRELRELFSTRQLLKKQIIMTKNRIKSILRQNMIVEPSIGDDLFKVKNKELIETLDLTETSKFQLRLLCAQLSEQGNEVNILEDQILKTATPYMKEIRILTSMKGVSVLMAIALLADISDIQRFANSKHLCSYLRTAPGVKSSNETTYVTKTNKCSRKLSMNFLIQSVMHFRRNNPKEAWYNKHQGHKSYGKLRMAICRKALAEMYHMLKKEQLHYWTDENNHKTKINKYVKFLQKNGVKIPSFA